MPAPWRRRSSRSIICVMQLSSPRDVHAGSAGTRRESARGRSARYRLASYSSGSTTIGPSRTMPTCPLRFGCCSKPRLSRSLRMPGIYLGFIAGAIGSNPAKAEKLIASFFPVAPEDEWVIVRAIAYSGLPDWRNALRRVAPRMPARRVMIDSYLAGKLPILQRHSAGGDPARNDGQIRARSRRIRSPRKRRRSIRR